MECMIHGCAAEATDKVLVYPGRKESDIPKGHGHPGLKADVCPEHKVQYDQDGYLGGLHVPDDPETYSEANKPGVP